ncbi:MAG: DUF3800 domain-containing protein [Planctomycetes bacterium]|nr:DUF3800 domain-containing protein [Planctomycetota bacterium]
MQIFIDESGDCGMRNRNSSPYFAVTAVFVGSPDAVSKCEAAIALVRAGLDLKKNFEFHFARIKEDFRRAILTEIADQEFTFVSCLLDKTRIRGKHWQSKEFLYEKVVGALVEQAATYLELAQKARPRAH